MCLTDATNLISHDPSNKKQKAALKALKKKLLKRKKELDAQVKDIVQGLKKVNKSLAG
jgi:hypothetical protein